MTRDTENAGVDSRLLTGSCADIQAPINMSILPLPEVAALGPPR